MRPARERQPFRRREAEQQRPTPAPRLWDRLLRYADLAWTGSLRLSATASLTVVIAFFVIALTDRSITIEPLSVPKTLAEQGFTATVAARVLRDAITTLAGTAKTTLLPHTTVQSTDLPDITIPTIGISVQTLATQLRHFLGITSHQTLSGEITRQGDRLFLALRLNGSPFFASPAAAGADPEYPGTLFADAARAALRQTQPYIFAALVQDTDKPLALAVVDSIIQNSSTGIKQTAFALNLKGFILRDLHRFAEATAAFQAAIKLDPRFAWPHDGLGAVLTQLHQPNEAIAEFQAAIKLDPKYAEPHNGLGIVLADLLDRPNEAIAEYQTAIKLDPKSALPHNNLGNALADLHRSDEAIAEYQTAIKLDPKLATPHRNLGLLLRDLGRNDEANTEFARATALDPSLEPPTPSRSVSVSVPPPDPHSPQRHPIVPPPPTPSPGSSP